MKTGLPAVITPQLIRKHNRGVILSGLIYFVGAVGFFLLTALLGWVVWGLLSGETNWQTLSRRGMAFCLIFALLVFRFGWRWHRTHDRAVDEVDQGVRIARRMSRARPVAGAGPSYYLTLGSRWLDAGVGAFRSRLASGTDRAAQLEETRRHMAARDSWEPLHSFAAHRDDLRDLALLGMITIREYEGVWSARVSLAGQTKRQEDD